MSRSRSAALLCVKPCNPGAGAACSQQISNVSFDVNAWQASELVTQQVQFTSQPSKSLCSRTSTFLFLCSLLRVSHLPSSHLPRHLPPRVWETQTAENERGFMDAPSSRIKGRTCCVTRPRREREKRRMRDQTDQGRSMRVHLTTAHGLQH